MAAETIEETKITEIVKNLENIENGNGSGTSPENAATQPPDVRYMGWRAMPYVICNETFEKLGTLGTSANMLVYLTTVFHMNNVTAATLMNGINGTTNLTPIVGAFISDTFLGRYATIGIASISSLTGMLVLTLTARIPTLHPPQCAAGQTCASATSSQLALLMSSFVFLMIGAGGIRPCNLAFGADQFDPSTESGKRGINSFFNWYYFTFTLAVMISATLIVYVQSNVNWALGLGIPTLLMFFSCVVFFAGTKIYVMFKPQGSPFTGIAQVIVAAIRKRQLPEPEDPKISLFNPPPQPSLSGVFNSKLSYTDQFKFFDKASIVTAEDEIKSSGVAANPWRLCSMQQVEETKCLIRILPIWSANLLVFVATTQLSTFVVFQALQSNRHLGHSSFQIPAGSFSVFTMLAVTLWIPIYDRLLVPWLRRVTGREGGITLLQRQGAGILLAAVAILIAAPVEQRRRRLALSAGSLVSPMSSVWLAPQLLVLGISEGFNSIGQIEFFYKEFPETMRSVAGAIFFLSVGLSNYICSFMISVVHRTTRNWLPAGDLNHGKLDYFYFSIAVIEIANLAYFVVCAKWYKYKNKYSPAEEIALVAA